MPLPLLDPSDPAPRLRLVPTPPEDELELLLELELDDEEELDDDEELEELELEELELDDEEELEPPP